MMQHFCQESKYSYLPSFTRQEHSFIQRSFQHKKLGLCLAIILLILKQAESPEALAKAQSF